MKKVLIGLLFASSLGIAIIFGVMAYMEYEQISNVQTKNKELRKEITNKVIDKPTNVGEESNDPLKRWIDFEALEAINPDIVGWIYIPETSIDYPILIGDTDDAYLYRDFEGKTSKYGSIFSYADTNRKLEDTRTILFGHNMKQHIMFGELKRYVREENFRKEHKNIYIYTKAKSMELEIDSIFVCENTDNFLKKYPMEQIDKPSFALVTCWGKAGTSKRLLVNAMVQREIILS